MKYSRQRQAEAPSQKEGGDGIKNASLKTTTVWTILITAIGKALGFLRNAILASIFGATGETDAFYMAININSMVSEISGAGLTATVVPLRTREMEKAGREHADRYAAAVLLVLMVLSGTLSLVSLAMAPQIAALIAPEFTAEQQVMTAWMLRLFSPMIAISSACLFLSNILHAHHRYIIVQIAVFPMSLAWLVIPLLFSGAWGIWAMAIGYLLGIILQLAVLVPALRGIYRLRKPLSLKSAPVRDTFRLAIPIYLASAVNIVALSFEKGLASGLPAGSLSALSYSNQLTHLVSGILITTLSTVLLTILSRHAAAQDTSGFVQSFSRFIRVTLLGIMPIIALFVLYDSDIIRVIYQRGSFDETAHGLTRSAFVFGSVSLLPTSIKTIANQTFYAIRKTKIPLIVTAIGSVILIAAQWQLVRMLEVGGLALGMGVSHTAMSILYFALLRREVGPLGLHKLLIDGAKILLALLPMIGAIWLMQRFVPLPPLPAIITGTAIGGLVYLTMLYLFRQRDLLEICRSLRLRFIKK